MMCRSSPCCSLRSATASAASPSSKLELGHGSCSLSVRDATNFPGRVQRPCVRAVGLRVPVAQHLLVRPPTEDEPGARSHAGPDRRDHELIAPRPCPAVVLKAVAPIFVGPTGRLHHAV